MLLANSEVQSLTPAVGPPVFSVASYTGEIESLSALDFWRCHSCLVSLSLPLYGRYVRLECSVLLVPQLGLLVIPSY